MAIDTTINGIGVDNVADDGFVPVWDNPSQTFVMVNPSVAFGSSLSHITSALGSNTINNGNNGQSWQWNTLDGGTAFLLSANTTLADNNSQTLFNLQLSGLNAKSNQSTYTASFENSHSGTGANNTALVLSAISGATNTALDILNGSLKLTPQTASRIAIIDANKNLISADTATYPSLTELSYVKGVTSSIQTQLNAKGTGTVTSVATGTGLTGGTITSTGTIALSTALAPMATLTGNGGKFLRVNAGETAVEYATVAGGSSAISGLTLATAGNTIDNTNYAQEWQWSTLAGGNGLKLSSTSTAAASNTQTLFNVALSGANGTSTQTTYASQFSNTHTGTSSTNYAGYFLSSGGTTNYALRGETQVTATNSASTIMQIAMDSTGTTAANFGGYIGFNSKVSTTTNVNIGNVGFVVDGTASGGSGRFVVQTLRNGSMNTYYTITGNGSGQHQFTGVIFVDNMGSNSSRFGYDGNNYMKILSTSSAQITFDITNNTGTPSYNFANFNFGIGTGTTVSAKLHVIQTTEQVRVGYNTTNYYSTTVSSTGQVSYDAVGSGSSFNFADKLGIGTGTTISANLHTLATTEQFRAGYDASNYLSLTVASNGSATFAVTGSSAEFTFSQKVNFSGVTAFGNVQNLKNYTVATLPIAPTRGDWAYVTDATAPTYGATVAGGGAVVTPVFYDGTNWTCR